MAVDGGPAPSGWRWQAPPCWAAVAAGVLYLLGIAGPGGRCRWSGGREPAVAARDPTQSARVHLYWTADAAARTPFAVDALAERRPSGSRPAAGSPSSSPARLASSAAKAACCRLPRGLTINTGCPVKRRLIAPVRCLCGREWPYPSHFLLRHRQIRHQV
jgi:hypothetical protein